jgi:drug/metabolite transporter (DMT)-like permease
VALLLGVALLGERLTALDVTGASLILAGVTVALTAPGA